MSTTVEIDVDQVVAVATDHLESFYSGTAEERSARIARVIHQGLAKRSPRQAYVLEGGSFREWPFTVMVQHAAPLSVGNEPAVKTPYSVKVLDMTPTMRASGRTRAGGSTISTSPISTASGGLSACYGTRPNHGRVRSLAQRTYLPNRYLTSTRGWATVINWAGTRLACIGAMGEASSVALGLARPPDRQIIVLDGDGSLLMNLGSVVTIAGVRPKNLIHAVCQNDVYEVTGGQKSPLAWSVLKKRTIRGNPGCCRRPFLRTAAIRGSAVLVARAPGQDRRLPRRVPGRRQGSTGAAPERPGASR